MSRNVSDLHPRLQAAVSQIKSKFPMIGIGECLRTVAEQDALYAQGRTKPGSIVTNAKGSTYSSQHQWGIAFDFFYNQKGNLYPAKFMNEVGAYAKSIGLAWGGDWKSPVDKPHLYLPDWGDTTSKLKSQYKTPDKFMATWGGTTTKATTSDSSLVSFVKQVQGVIGAKIDGIAGSETLGKTPTISAIKNNRHAIVSVVQRRLNELGYNCGTIDGIFGNKTKQAVISYQKAKGCIADGEITAKANTWKKLLGMA